MGKHKTPKEYHRDYYHANKEARKKSIRQQALKRLYGITVEQYDELLQKQKGRCGVCKRPAEQFRVRLAVDHDHATGAIRGLLCISCNRRTIGRHREGTGAVELFAHASEYLKPENYTGWFVPPKKKKTRKRK